MNNKKFYLNHINNMIILYYTNIILLAINKMYNCSICEKVFKLNHHYKRHINKKKSMLY